MRSVLDLALMIVTKTNMQVFNVETDHLVVHKAIVVTLAVG